MKIYNPLWHFQILKAAKWVVFSSLCQVSRAVLFLLSILNFLLDQQRRRGEQGELVYVFFILSQFFETVHHVEEKSHIVPPPLRAIGNYEKSIEKF